MKDLIAKAILITMFAVLGFIVVSNIIFWLLDLLVYIVVSCRDIAVFCIDVIY